MKYTGLILFFLIHTSLGMTQSGLTAEIPVQYLPISYCNDQESAILGGVHCFVEDKQGFMWIGSENGLFRYDGFRLTPYHELSISPSTKSMASVSDLTMGDDGRLYAGLNTGEILAISPETFESQLFRMSQGAVLKNVLDTYAICFDKGIVWTGTESGLLRFDPKTEKFDLFKPSLQDEFGIATDVVYSIMPNNSNTKSLWVGTRTQLLSFDLEKQLFTSYRINFQNLRSHSRQIFGCLRQTTDKLWCSGYASGLKIMDKTTGTWQDLLPNASRQDIIEMVFVGNEVYAVHYDLGLGRLDTNLNRLVYLRDPGRKVASYEREKYWAVYVDRAGYIWVGSETGFARLKPGNQQIRHVFLPARPDESEFFFTSSVEDMGDFYLAVTSFGYGFYKWYKATGRIERISNPIFKQMETELDIFHTHKRADGSVDIFSRKGIWRYNPVNDEIRPLNLNIMATHAEPWREDYIILTGRSTLKHIRDYRVVHTFEFDYQTSGIERIIHFSIEGDELWAVGNSSIIRINLANGERTIWQNSPEKEYFAYGFLFTIAYHEGTVVVGNNSAGFEVFELKDDELHLRDRYHRDISGRRIRVTDAEQHADKVYLASNQGLIIYDLAEGELIQIDSADGLLVQNLGKTWISNIEIFDDGNIIVSGHGFFTIVHEPSIEPANPELRISQLTQHGASLSSELYTRGLELAYDENFFELTFGVQPIRIKNRLQYRHRLRGFDDQWITTHDGEVRYASIPPGEYLLEIQASSSYLWKNKTMLTLPVSVIPPFYQTYWFYALCVLSLLSIGIYLYHNRVSYIRRQEELKTEYNQKVAQLEIEALRAQMNPHFIFNALNSIEYYINEENTEDAINYLQKFAALIRLTLQNSKQSYISLRDELVSLQHYIEIEQMRLDNTFDFQVEIAEGLQTERIMLQPLLLQPYVENAIWHGLLYQREKRGKLWIRCVQDGKRTEIRITDNGIGREKSATIQKQRMKNKKSMGMIITKRRIELNKAVTGIHTSVNIEDLKDSQGQCAGTSVIINLVQELKHHA